MSIDYTLKMYIDWNDDGDFEESNEDVSSSVQVASTRRGRSAVQDSVAPGEMSFSLINTDGTYSPFNSGSLLYGSMYPGRRVKLEVHTANGVFPIFFGDLGDFGQAAQIGEIPVSEATAYDAMERFGFGDGRTKIQALKDVRADEIIWEVLANNGFTEIMDLDTAYNFLVAHWAWNMRDRDIIERATREDLGATSYIGNDGRFCFRNKTWRAEKTSRLTISGARATAVGLRREDFLTQVVLSRSGLIEDLEQTVVFSLSPTGQRMEPGSSSALNTIVGEYYGAAFSVVTPVANTDWTFNTEPDGSGVDKTAQVTVHEFIDYGGGFQITFSNNDASDVYLTLLDIRGIAMEQSNDDRDVTSDVVSPVVTDNRYTEQYECNDDVVAIQAYGNYIAGVSNILQPRPTVEVVPKTTSALEDFLRLEYGDRVTLDVSDPDQALYINADFHVESIEWNFAVGSLPTVRLGLLHRDFVRGSVFRISSPTDVTKQYSRIAAAGATSGDRIGW